MASSHRVGIAMIQAPRDVSIDKVWRKAGGHIVIRRGRAPYSPRYFNAI